MKKDVLKFADGIHTSKRPSKETLNHPGLVYLASGLDPYKQTSKAYLKAYESLGIDILNRVPDVNAPEPLKIGEICDEGNGYQRAHLGLYDTYCRHRYPFNDVDEFWNAKEMNLKYNELITPVPHTLKKEDIEYRMTLAGETGSYYYMLYTTLFMWGVEYLGWEVFMLASHMDPDGFKEKFLDPAFEKSSELINILCQIDSPFVFCHDDLADARGPIFSPSWYEKYIFPKYHELWKPIKEAGKKMIFVADGNMATLIEPLKEIGIDGVMFENPATDFELILKHFVDKIVIGGIDTKILTFATPEEIHKLVLDVHELTKDMPGFAMSSPGGIHGNIPIENLEAYFDARVETGHTKAGWRKI